MAKKQQYIFVGYNEDFEDTSVRIYNADSEDQVHLMFEMDFFQTTDEGDLREEDRERFQEFVENNPYKVVLLGDVEVDDSSEYTFETETHESNKRRIAGFASFVNEVAELTEDDLVEFTEDVECEIFTDQNQRRGNPNIVNKGEEVDIFSVPDKGSLVGVQFADGAIAWVDKKFLKKKSGKVSESESTGRSGVDTFAMRKVGIKEEDIQACVEVASEIAEKTGDKGTCVIGGGLMANGREIVGAYSQGNDGPERIYIAVRDLLKDKYPNIKFEIEWGNMD